jgi:LPXTG-motif cell wall-anchored protein
MPHPTAEQVHLFTVLSNAWLALVGLLGLGTLLGVWARGRRQV